MNYYPNTWRGGPQRDRAQCNRISCIGLRPALSIYFAYKVGIISSYSNRRLLLLANLKSDSRSGSGFSQIFDSGSESERETHIPAGVDSRISDPVLPLGQRWAESHFSDSDSALAPRFKTPAPAPKSFETSTPTLVNTPKTSKWLTLKWCSLVCLRQNTCCCFFAFGRPQIVEMVTWLAQYSETQHVRCGSKLWLSLIFKQHRQTQPLKACPHLN